MAVIDLGFNGTFAISHEHLHDWAGLDARLFPRIRGTRLRGAVADVRMANIWLHPNAAKTRNPSGRSPWRLELFNGIFVMQKPGLHERDDRPQLPLLGFRALYQANLRLAVDCERRRLSLRTPRRFWFFA
jgi:hypothetical protein